MLSETAQRWAIVMLALITGFAALKLADDLFAPVAVAFVVGGILAPVIDRLERVGVPRVVSALAGLGVSIGGLAVIVMGLGPILGQAVDEAPKVWEEMRNAVSWMKNLAEGFDNMSDEVTRAIDPESENAARTAAGQDEESLKLPTLGDVLFLAPALVAQAMLFAGTLFFFLLGRLEIYHWISARISPPSLPAAGENRLLKAERLVSRYFLTITLINGSFGVLVGLAMFALGMPAPVLWGLFAMLMNYILYLGPAVVAGCLLLGALVTFDGVMVAVPALSFIAMNVTEGQFVTPALVGRSMHVNPLLVFLSLVLGLWMWGPLGGIVAIPILMWVLMLSGMLDGTQTISSGSTGTGAPKTSADATS